MMGEGVGEDEVRDDGDKNAQEEEGPRDHCVPSLGLVNAHPPETGLEAPELIANVGEAVCIHALLRNSDSVLFLVVASTTMHPLAIDDSLDFLI
ncbi:hypothetical protein BHE74_00008820 [Ensete ventricosum]|nr:hypothetical protein BHE74_00008820 [Ensete ventricosum]